MGKAAEAAAGLWKIEEGLAWFVVALLRMVKMFHGAVQYVELCIVNYEEAGFLGIESLVMFPVALSNVT